MLGGAAAYHVMEAHFLEAFQYADLAGFGEVVGNDNNAIVIDVEMFWAGSFPTNPITICNAFDEWSDDMLNEIPNVFSGKRIVFFAMTNEWKSTSPLQLPTTGVVLDNSVTFTNVGGYCAPKFVMRDPPTWFAIATNDCEHLAFYSNIVKSIVVSRDRDLLYTTLRDVIKSDYSVGKPYRAMAFMPIWQLFWTSSETNLVTALNDPLLARRLRNHALFQLKQRFGWPATNTVPEL
jgi:hypothetical protein